VSSAGCDYAERDKQPHLREFIDLEVRPADSRRIRLAAPSSASF